MCVCVEISPRTPPFSPRARLLLPPALPAASSPCLALATSMALDHDQPVKVRPDLLSPRAPTFYRRAAACYGFTGAPSSWACQPDAVSVGALLKVSRCLAPTGRWRTSVPLYNNELTKADCFDFEHLSVVNSQANTKKSNTNLWPFQSQTLYVVNPPL
jgi:hypothetical protein